jgi:Ca-activated chloride channel family protein
VMDVKTISPDELVSSLSDPNEVDLVVVSDVPANSYTNEQVDTLHHYVHETGGGLIALGGRLAFEKARLEGSNIEPLLPVSAPIRPGKPRETLAMVLVIDKSGSMLEEDRMRLAKEAAKESVKLLVSTDKVGIVAFGDDFEWVSELAPCGDKREVFAKISGLKAAGRTNMYSAMIRAHLALDQAIADRKHAVILTDGVASPGDFEQLSKQMADAGITVSTISIGKDPDRSLLIDIARTARGRFHACNDPKEIRDVLVEETLAAVDTEKKSVRAQVARQLPGLSVESAPALLGYSPTTTKPDAELLLWAADGDPLLAWWPYGAGRVAAFTSDVKNEGGRDWQSWDGATIFWTRVATLSRRRAVPDNVQISLARFNNQNHILVDAVDEEGAYWNEYLKVSEADSSETHTMKFIGPGRHQLQLPVADQQADSQYQLHVGSKIISFAVAANYENEYIVGPANEQLLRRIAAASGGTYDVNLEDVFVRSGKNARQSIPIWSYLAGLACLLFVIEIAIRRLLRPRYEPTSQT